MSYFVQVGEPPKYSVKVVTTTNMGDTIIWYDENGKFICEENIDRYDRHFEDGKKSKRSL